MLKLLINQGGQQMARCVNEAKQADCHLLITGEINAETLSRNDAEKNIVKQFIKSLHLSDMASLRDLSYSNEK